MMALHTRLLKIGFSSHEVYWGVLNKREYLSIVALFNFVVRGMKFSYDYVLAESEGEQLPNGTWTGIKGLLNRSEVDFALASLMMTEEEWDAVAYNYPFASDELVFATRKPEYSPEIMALFRTLSPNVWLSLLACALLVILVCFVAMKNRSTLEDILLHVLAIALNQEGNLVPQRAGEVILLCTWTGAMTVFTFCLKSVLLSFLTFPMIGGVRTVQELAAAIRTGQCTAFRPFGNDFSSYLLRSPNEDFRVIGESMVKNPHGYFLHFIDERPTYPIKAFVYTKSYASFLGRRLYVSKDRIHSLNFATAVRKNFCCKDEMDMLIHRFLAAGINLKFDSFRDYAYTWLLSLEVSDDEEKNIRKITATDISGALIILVAGHCLSVFVLIFECWIKHRLDKNRLHSLTRTI